jgi:hypothetical protein
MNPHRCVKQVQMRASVVVVEGLIGCVCRNVVPYLPGLMLLWKAHCNVQRVTQEGFSVYLLKYALKVRPMCASCATAGGMSHEPCLQINTVEPFRLDAQLAKGLGLPDLSEEKLHLVSASVASRLVAPCEAALICLGLPLVEADVQVESISVQPPGAEVRSVHAVERGGAHHRAAEKYALRPWQQQVGLLCFGDDVCFKALARRPCAHR